MKKKTTILLIILAIILVAALCTIKYADIALPPFDISLNDAKANNNKDSESEPEINNANYDKPQVYEVNLPISVRDGGSFLGAFTIAGDYFYYECDDGNIYKSPIDNPEQREAVYELPLWTYGSGYVYPHLSTVDNYPILSYHQGGASMGTDYQIRINEDGTSEILNEGHSRKIFFRDITLKFSYGIGQINRNLAVKKNDDDEYTNIGNPDYFYHYKFYLSNGDFRDDVYRIGDNIYLLARYSPASGGGSYLEIHEVNIKTGEDVKLCDNFISSFTILDNTIYFLDSGDHLYKMQVGESTVERLLDTTVDSFVVLNHQVYYIKKYGGELYKLGDDSSINPGGHVKNLYSDGGYVTCTFEDDSISQYKMMVIDNKGDVIFKTTDAVSHVKTNGNQIFYIKADK